MENNIRSLRSYLMQRLLISIYLLWIVSTVVGYFATINYANQPYDLVLLQRANEVAAELKLGSGHEQLDVVPPLPDGTELGMPDKVLYTVTDSEGRKLAGNGNTLRPLSYRRDRKGPLFSNGEREGQKTRMVSLTFNFQRQHPATACFRNHAATPGAHTRHSGQHRDPATVADADRACRCLVRLEAGPASAGKIAP